MNRAYMFAKPDEAQSVTSDQRHRLGSKGMDRDGNVYAYVKFTVEAGLGDLLTENTVGEGRKGPVTDIPRGFSQVPSSVTVNGKFGWVLQKGSGTVAVTGTAVTAGQYLIPGASAAITGSNNNNGGNAVGRALTAEANNAVTAVVTIENSALGAIPPSATYQRTIGMTGKDIV